MNRDDKGVQLKKREEVDPDELKLFEKGDFVDVHYPSGGSVNGMRYLGFGSEGLVYVLDETNHIVGIRNWLIIRTSTPKSKDWVEKALK